MGNILEGEATRPALFDLWLDRNRKTYEIGQIGTPNGHQTELLHFLLLHISASSCVYIEGCCPNGGEEKVAEWLPTLLSY